MSFRLQRQQRRGVGQMVSSGVQWVRSGTIFVSLRFIFFRTFRFVSFCSSRLRLTICSWSWILWALVCLLLCLIPLEEEKADCMNATQDPLMINMCLEPLRCRLVSSCYVRNISAFEDVNNDVEKSLIVDVLQCLDPLRILAPPGYQAFNVLSVIFRFNSTQCLAI